MRYFARKLSAIPFFILFFIFFSPFEAACQNILESEPSKKEGEKTPNFIDDISKQALVTGEKIITKTVDDIRGKTILAGINFGQANLTFNRDQPLADGKKARASLTDNGRFTPLLQYETTESFLYDYPLLVGKIRVGYNLIFGLSSFETDKQQVDNAFQGEALGSWSNGYYLKVAPLLFIKLGPLSKERKVYWKFGIGVGGALMNFDADVIYQGNMVSENEHISQRFESLNLFSMYVTEIQINNWSILYRAETLTNVKYNSGRFTFEYFSLSLGYTIKF